MGELVNESEGKQAKIKASFFLLLYGLFPESAIHV